MSDDELMKTLLAERFNGVWWKADTTPTEAERQAAHEKREWVERGRMRGVA